MRPEFYYQRIGSIMRDNQFDRTTSGHRSGLLGHKLYKVAMDSDRVFDRKEERKNKKYNVVIMLDESGSMNCGRMPVAAQSTTMIARALQKSYIDFAILGFNMYIRLHKSFEDKFTNKEYDNMQREILSAPYNGGGCNHDLTAVIQTEELIRGKNPNNTIVMLFVDGQPECGCACGAANPDGLLAKTAERVAKKCKFVTFAIQTNHADNYYPNVVHITDLNQFMVRSLYAFQTLIKRG
jgi:cobalamin biosynthesis protein CobT